MTFYIGAIDVILTERSWGYKLSEREEAPTFSKLLTLGSSLTAKTMHLLNNKGWVTGSNYIIFKRSTSSSQGPTGITLSE